MTPADVLSQLRCMDIRVELTKTGTLKLNAPDGIDLAPMLRVIKKFKPGIVKLLRGDSGPGSHLREPFNAIALDRLPPRALAVVEQVQNEFGTVSVVSIKDSVHEPRTAAPKKPSSSDARR